ncbi:pentatricopeptide repeat-containing protein [Dorcoceras hygrometricum]|uniref:Pentatricopeptide repeat-containing protein n=1 Tax=Dorcoceras hygrometricum TaxID=472368 RepID=A0A2Z7CPG4_9LAMI|nr:pentatricopeptide repeat-containing protein [Dorcoceras hygrometricum]
MRFIRQLQTTFTRSYRSRTRIHAHTTALPERRNNNVTDSDVVKCNIAITDYMRNGQCNAALCLFNSMPRKTSVSYNTMISGYLSNSKFNLAQKLFDVMPQRDLVSWNVMLTGHIKNNNLGAARLFFDEMPAKDVVSWNAMLSGYAQNGLVHEARRIFDLMPEKNEISWNGILAAYVQNGMIEQARRLFDSKEKWAVVSWNCLMGGYLKRKRMVEAREIFDRMPERDEVSWNTMITCCAQNGKLDEARRNISSWNTIITGYSQNGDIAHARSLFDRMHNRDCISWAAIIAGYAQSGDSEEAIRMFVEMKRDGERINRSAFTSVLSTCSDVAAFMLGKQIHGRVIKAGFEFGCYVGNALLAMYCRCGSIVEAHEVFMGIEHRDIVSWNTIIIGYSRHGFSKEALEHFDAMKEARIQPDEVTMIPGYSWVEVQNKIHTFSVGDFAHPESEIILAFLEELDLRMKLDGYISTTKLVLHDVEEEEKQQMLKYHSEKLAVAYGIIKTPKGRPLHVFKNLRVCEDCHTAIKHMAKITERLIILRDPNRFHHFNGGECNCGDYW